MSESNAWYINRGGGLEKIKASKSTYCTKQNDAQCQESIEAGLLKFRSSENYYPFYPEYKTRNEKNKEATISLSDKKVFEWLNAEEK